MDTPLAQLHHLLDRYDPPAAEESARRAILHLIADGSKTLSADHFVPGHVTASAFVVDRSRTRTLLIHHTKLRKWLQPGGHVDEGEDVLTAAIREVAEETGVAGVPIRPGVFDIDIHPIPPSGGRPHHNHYDIRFLLGAESETLVESDEVLGVRWVSFGEVAAMNTDESVLRATAKLIELFG